MENMNIDPEDLEDLIIRIEQSFQIHFEDNELADIRTLGELCDSIKDKIKLEKGSGCTSQQAFYKVRDAISKITGINENTITPSSDLNFIFPTKSRRQTLIQIENYMGIKTSILRPPHFITSILLLIFIGSCISLTFNGNMGLLGILISILGFYISFRTGKVLDISTVGEYSKRFMQDNYVMVRRDQKTYNEDEIDPFLIDFFASHLLIQKDKLNRETILFD
ncbi:hypothetical protein AWW67_01340 [Roseivirga seohaensis]|uniref:Carrier domain-containing protein n=1 Tax=Roseivirga seohaensis TaxID=1914963 RepID=A0A150Y1B2_9BACT|nr:hypothetical protein [Roseivirga seohaensis]KYG84716.1 hypothetical protein AWW67_01340 [Roseivirga seohaensis]